MKQEIWHGDCLELMKNIPDGSIDCVITDPPYGTTSCKWDACIPFEPMWEQLKRVTKKNGAIVLFGSQPFTSALVMSNVKDFKQLQVWDKCMPVGFLNAKKKILSRHEDIVVFSPAPFGHFTYNPQMRKGKMRNKTPKRAADTVEGRAYNTVTHKGDNFNDQYYPTSILELSNAHQTGKVHPTQKPVALMEYLIKTYSNEWEMILDFTAGSGSTGVAAKNLNRQFILIEKEKEYYDICVERLK